MKRRLKIAVLRDRYQTEFNTPRVSRHIVKPVFFLPGNKISRHIEGITLITPSGADLGHFQNRIPAFCGMPFLMSFESHLPRYFGGARTKLFHFMQKRLASDQCRRIIALSHYAKSQFLRQHTQAPEFDRLKNKLEVVYPNISLPVPRLEPRANRLPLRLVFVGRDFGRKGGAVAARAAEIARMKKLPLHFHIISALNVGQQVWSDPRQDNFFEPYIRLLDAENITFDRQLPNAQVVEAMRDGDFLMLPSVSDSFGYSIFEAFGVGTPAITTKQGPIPEFVAHGKNGIMIPLAIDEMGEWVHISRGDKGSADFAEMFRSEIERMAHELIDAVAPYCDAPQNLLPMRKAARDTAETMFNSVKTSAYLDDLYERCAAG